MRLELLDYAVYYHAHLTVRVQTASQKYKYSFVFPLFLYNG